MEITTEMKSRLASLIVSEISRNFEFIHLSHNLVDTIKIDSYINEKNEEIIRISIPAPVYDLAIFRKTGAIIPTKGSYAETVNRTGGFSGSHKNYVNDSIMKAYNRWVKEYGITAKLR